MAMTIEQVREELTDSGGFVKPHHLPAIIADNRLTPLLGRCQGCRLHCTAQDLDHILEMVRLSGIDSVRDVSMA